MSRPLHTRRSKSFAAFIGGPFIASSGDKASVQTEAEDITQGFFASLLEHRNLNAVRKEQGRLRSYLLGALKYFLANERRRAMAIKRGKGQRLIPLEELRADERVEMEPADPVTAELIYERRWASTVLERVLNLLKDEYRRAGNAALFDSLKELLPGEADAPSQKEIAAQLGMTENAVGRRFTDFGSITNRYCERKLLRQLQRPAISKTSCAISSRWFERKDTNYCKTPHELHKLSSRA